MLSRRFTQRMNDRGRIRTDICAQALWSSHGIMQAAGMWCPSNMPVLPSFHDLLLLQVCPLIVTYDPLESSSE